MVLVFTLCSNNYLAQANTLGNSLLKCIPTYKFIIGLVDRKQESFNYSKIPYEIIEVEQIGIPYFEEMRMRYNIIELNTACKPFFYQYFFKAINPRTIIYLDPDIEVFAPFKELEEELASSDIVITPHFTTPFYDDKWQAEEDFLNSGLYNLGFIAINNTEIGNSMVSWWSERMRNKAYMDFRRGLFYDQIWINFVPLFFKKVKVFTNIGYNVAYWNLHERIISERNGNYFVNETQPLVFYHYASYRPLNPGVISTGQNRHTLVERTDIAPLFNNYCKMVLQNNYEKLVKYPCYFVDHKEKIDRQRLIQKIQEIPKYKRAIGKVVRWIIRKFNIIMDYSTLK